MTTKQTTHLATFTAGCFWCIEATFEHLQGVSEVVAGYTGGTTKNPTYEEVCEGKTDHLEAVEVHFDPERYQVYRRGSGRPDHQTSSPYATA